MNDLVIRNGTFIDGTGRPPRYADITVDDGRVVDVGRASGGARRVIDAGGLVAPRTRRAWDWRRELSRIR